jgi:hypothetical protein
MCVLSLVKCVSLTSVAFVQLLQAALGNLLLLASHWASLLASEQTENKVLKRPADFAPYT